jgi:hypothetical protein
VDRLWVMQPDIYTPHPTALWGCELGCVAQVGIVCSVEHVKTGRNRRGTGLPAALVSWPMA